MLKLCDNLSNWKTVILIRTKRTLLKNNPAVPPSGSADERKQLEAWRKYIDWEKANSLRIEDKMVLSRRVMFAYQQCLLVMGHHAELWYEVRTIDDSNYLSVWHNLKLNAFEATKFWDYRLILVPTDFTRAFPYLRLIDTMIQPKYCHTKQISNAW